MDVKGMIEMSIEDSRKIILESFERGLFTIENETVYPTVLTLLARLNEKDKEDDVLHISSACCEIPLYVHFKFIAHIFAETGVNYIQPFLNAPYFLDMYEKKAEVGDNAPPKSISFKKKKDRTVMIKDLLEEYFPDLGAEVIPNYDCISGQDDDRDFIEEMSEDGKGDEDYECYSIEDEDDEYDDGDDDTTEDEDDSMGDDSMGNSMCEKEIIDLTI